MSLQELIATAPLLIVTATGLIVLLIEALRDESETLTCWTGISGLALAIGVALSRIGEPAGSTAYSGMVTTGGFANFFAILFCAAGFLTFLLSSSYIGKTGIRQGEFYALVLFAVAGMILMASSADLVVFFLGLEIMSVSFYVLAGFARGRLMSNEAALKYFLLGAFATGFLLYGIALVYGATGSTALAGLAARASAGTPLLMVGLGMLMIGLSFKVAAVPFHMWVPDVYEGSPTTVSGFMSTGGKAAAFSGFLLAFGPVLMALTPEIRQVLAVIAALSMLLGNLIAVAQSGIKRMLAYSSIAHAGYILTGVVAGNAAGTDGILYYLMSYTLMNIGAFGVVAILERADGDNLTFDECAGLSRRSPWLSGLMALFMFSLAGIPPFAGFFGKYYVFAGAVEAGYTWLAIVGVIMSVVSAYYYLRLVVLMYFRDGREMAVAGLPPLGIAALVVAAVGVVGFGMYPSALLDLTAHCF
ncbi:MAG: NADH-quinone oxidoreductase subunit N [Bacteroidota bacterium]